MGEIKSTLDLVMERTRHLSLSDEERKRQQAAEFEKRLQGLLQQYADGAETPGTVRERLAKLKAEMKVADDQGLVGAVVGRLDPDQDNAHWLALLEKEAPAVCAPLQAALAAHREKRAVLLAAGEQDQLERLAREHAIAGTAVIPNPLQNDACRERLAALSKETRAGFEALLDQY